MPDDFDEIEKRLGGKASAAPVMDDFDAIEARLGAPKAPMSYGAMADALETGPGLGDSLPDGPNYAANPTPVRPLTDFEEAADSQLRAIAPEHADNPEFRKAFTTNGVLDITKVGKFGEDRAKAREEALPAWLATAGHGGRAVASITTGGFWKGGLTKEDEALIDANKTVQGPIGAAVGAAGTVLGAANPLGPVSLLTRGAKAVGLGAAANPTAFGLVTGIEHRDPVAGLESALFVGGAGAAGRALRGPATGAAGRFASEATGVTGATVAGDIIKDKETDWAGTASQAALFGTLAAGNASPISKEYRPGESLRDTFRRGVERTAEAQAQAAEMKQAKFDAAVAGEPKAPESVDVTLARGERRLAESQAPAPEAPAAPREEVIQPRAGEPTTEAAPPTPVETKPTSKEYLASIRAADLAREKGPRPETESITPANDRIIGENADGVPIYERADGFRYRVRDGRVMTGGDLAPRTEAPPVEATPDNLTLVGKTNKGVGVYQRPGYQPGDTLVTRGEGGRIGAAHPRDVAEAKANALAEAARKPAVPAPPEPLPTVGEQLAQHAEGFINPGGKSVSPEAGFVHPEILAAAGGKIREGASRVAGAVRDAWTGLANKTFPKMTAENPDASAALASKVSTRVTAELFKRRVSEEVLGTDVDAVEFGGALVEANLRDVRRKMVADGDTEGAAKVVSTLGAEGAPFATEQAWRDYLAKPEVRAAIKRHNEMWERDVDPLYKAAQDIAETADLPTRGAEAGNARINLMRVDVEGNAADGNGVAIKPTGPIVGGQGNTGNLFTRKSPFGRKATGAAEGGYALDYRDMMGNTYNKQATNAYYKRGLTALEKNGDGLYVPRGTPAPTSIKGEPVVMLDVKGPSGQRFAVRARFASELRSAIGIDATPQFTPIIDRLVKGINKTALVGITDNVIHTANTMAILMTRPMSGLRPGVDAALSGAFRADLVPTLAKFTRNLFSGGERTAALEELANNSALSRGGVEAPTTLGGKLNVISRIGARIDVAARLTAYDAWKAMAKRGEVVDSPASLREFVNQFGQYTSQATDPVSRWLKQVGLAPFLVAGKRGLTTAIKTPTLSPGVKATKTTTAIALRGAMLAKIAGTVGAIALSNYKKTGDVSGGSGVPLFALVTGKDEKTGEVTYQDPLAWMGLRKAFNLYGGKYVETKRMGLTDSDAGEAQIQNVLNALGFYLRGPAVDLAVKTATGHSAGFNMPTYEKVGPERNQVASDFKNALLDAPKSLMNVVGGLPGVIGVEGPSNLINKITGQDKTADERMSEGLSYFGERKGRTKAQQESLPDRARYAQFKEFEQDVYSKIVRVPAEKREAYLKDRLDDSALTADEKQKVRVRVSKFLRPQPGGNGNGR